MTLRQYLKEHGAQLMPIAYGNEITTVLVYPLNENNFTRSDRFETFVMYDSTYPNCIFILQKKMRGLTIIPCSRLIENHNNLATTAKRNYEALINNLIKLDIKLEYNESIINL